MRFAQFRPVDVDRASVAQLELVGASFGQKVPPVWREIADLNFVALRCVDVFKAMSDQALADMAVELVYQLVCSMGGTGVYLPNGLRLVKCEKHALIASEYRGNNIQALAKKHRISDVQVRQIIREQADLKKAQDTSR